MRILKYFGWADVILVLLITLSLTYCNGSPGVVKPEPKYQATLEEGIDFTKIGSPTFIKKMIGLAGREDWGRWSDQDVVVLEFERPLPTAFTLELHAKGFGPNVGKETKIIVGQELKHIKLTGEDKTFLVNIYPKNHVTQIQIIPPQPTSPQSLDPQNSDSRKLGIGISALKISPDYLKNK